MTGPAASVHLVPEIRDRATVVTVTGTLGSETYPDLRNGLLKIVTDAPDGVIADIGGLTIEEDRLASLFATIALRIRDWPGVPFALVTPRPEHFVLLARQAVGRFVTVHPDVGTAERELDHPPRRRAVQLLAARVGASALARQFIARVCAEWQVPEHTEDALVIATELVENTIRHTDSAPRLRLELRRGVFTVAVADDDPRPAVLHERVDSTDPGLGLQMVAQIARVWGCSGSWAGGKVVWAVLARAGGRAGDPGRVRRAP
ncbi:ATP-binding protein [Amycolatopsis mongoliensis]|uniref:ATP-binding protein n=1 Tax=Amycolatopsis mongoliensis TaxID=715475 RepID=A0A9Y2NB80_9PSEU|nr:ATP-binding protein [Amycolatopsis sp. 4-36]WIX99355.1 ATP-binding protein [Amycolatopsis sp. 4-36]